jgi:hypothetical protein
MQAERIGEEANRCRSGDSDAVGLNLADRTHIQAGSFRKLLLGQAQPPSVPADDVAEHLSIFPDRCHGR